MRSKLRVNMCVCLGEVSSNGMFADCPRFSLLLFPKFGPQCGMDID